MTKREGYRVRAALARSLLKILGISSMYLWKPTSLLNKERHAYSCLIGGIHSGPPQQSLDVGYHQYSSQTKEYLSFGDKRLRQSFNFILKIFKTLENLLQVK